MDIDALKAFIAVSEEQSFSAAAEKLFVTQPAISKRISSLENQLECRLFDRIGKQIQLTEAGSLLLPKARKILTDITDARQAVKDLSGEIAGDLHVATSHHIGLHKLPPALREFTKLCPKVNLRFEFLDSEVASERVLQGKCELALVTLPPVTEPPLTATPLWLDPLVFVTGHNDSIPRKLSLAQLSEQPAILPDLNTYTGRLIQQYFRNHNCSLNLNMATNYLETIKMLCSVGLGWSVLPKSMVDEQLVELDIITEVEHRALSRTLGIIQHKSRTPSKAGMAFMQCLTPTSPQSSHPQH